MSEHRVNRVAAYNFVPFNSLLISLIKTHELLWNRKDLHYRNESKKNEAWDKVAKTLNESVDNCMHRWQSLRTSFVRRRKKNGVDAAKNYVWTHMEEMEFLGSQIKQRGGRKKKKKSGSRNLASPSAEESDEDSEASIPSASFKSQWGEGFETVDLPEFTTLPAQLAVGQPQEDLLQTEEESTEESTTPSSNTGKSPADSILLQGVCKMLQQSGPPPVKKTANEHFCESISLQLQEYLEKNPKAANSIKLKAINFISTLSNEFD